MFPGYDTSGQAMGINKPVKLYRGATPTVRTRV